jgi:hypothetical protein
MQKNLYVTQMSSIILSICAGLLISCGEKNRTVNVRTPSGSDDPNSKIVNQIPPNFSPTQIVVGNSITWLKQSPNGKRSCIQWQIIDKTNDSASIQILTSYETDCKKFSNIHEIIRFDLNTLKVLRHQQYDGLDYTDKQQGSLKDKFINAYFLTTDQKMEHSIGSESLSLGGKDQFPVFRLKTSGYVYYLGNQEDTPHPWHSTIMKFRDNETPSNQYFYFSSVPPLVGLKP